MNIVFKVIYKTILTAMIFGMGIAIVVSTYPEYDPYVAYDIRMFMIATAAIAFGSMFIVWMLPVILGLERDRPSPKQSAEKAKRQTPTSKYELLLELMDDHEREAFKQQLKRQVLDDMRYGDDGELPFAADTLFDDEDGGRHRQYE